jgi:hypothetical protein
MWNYPMNRGLGYFHRAATTAPRQRQHYYCRYFRASSVRPLETYMPTLVHLHLSQNRVSHLFYLIRIDLEED